MLSDRREDINFESQRTRPRNWGTCAKKDHTMRRADEIMGRPWRGVIIVSLNTSLKGLPGAPPDDTDEMRSVDPRR